jgi:hypothetical protein
MLIYEYGFATTGGKRPSARLRSFDWDDSDDFFGGPAKLVPQVLRYVVFHNSPFPSEYTDLFAVR